MNDADDLVRTLNRIDGRGYKAYRDIGGSYEMDGFDLFIDRVQGDPFASPSRIRARVPLEEAGFPVDYLDGNIRRIALRDYLTRTFCSSASKNARGRRGLGSSGLIQMDRPGQEILDRSSFMILDDHVEARFVMGLPAQGRRISGRDAEEMFIDELPVIVSDSMFFPSLEQTYLRIHIETAVTSDRLRRSLAEHGLVAFVADGSILPRRSGIDQRPMKSSDAVPFESPESLRVDLPSGNGGTMSGMGIEEGITLIAGGGYHGKSTLLSALELGIYDHVPGDGRERVVSDPYSVKIRAEDGRRIEKVDISPFIGNLPLGKDTSIFSTDDASGSTSQAANIIESMEAGATVLLIDEDTSATNFMIRDHRMQELITKDREPITPFIDKVRSLHTGHGISTILVMGGSGDYLDVADRVICMESYVPHDRTEEAMRIAGEIKTSRVNEGGNDFGSVRQRIPLGSSLDPSKGRRDRKVSIKGVRTIQFGRSIIDLSSVSQLVDLGQTRGIAEGLLAAMDMMDDRASMSDILDRIELELKNSGIDLVARGKIGDTAVFRKLELAAAINRLRTLSVR
ncbi:MAG: ABC-ATPase domain-containing protein [Thermoplasmatota archaeon]